MGDVSAAGLENPIAYSVGDLLRIRMGDDRWHLALVQRDEVWDAERMQRLLDSLLAGYPVGALLLCRTKTGVPSKVISRDGDAETVEEAREGAYQLLDGQQRLNALYTMLTAADEKHRRAYGRFYLDLTVERQPPSPAGTGRRAPAMPYLVRREEPDDALGEEGNGFEQRRGRCVDLSLLCDWAGRDGAMARGDELLAADRPGALAHEIDPRFIHELDGEERSRAEDWLRRLLRMWRDPVVPVMYATVDRPEDILELFARLNRGGIPFRDADIYFAAVKTFWNEAEPRLKRVVDATQLGAGDRHAFLTMERALRLISRLAGRGLGGGDVLPLTVERIAGNRREAMVAAMEALTSDDSPVLKLLDRFFEEYPSKSRLKYGLRYVSHQLWDEVLGWAVTRGRWDDTDLHAIDAYLFGGTVFHYATIFRASFSRNAFMEALAAGARGEPFPLRSILLATREKHPSLAFGRRQVAALSNTEENQDDRRWLADNSVALLLSIAQGIDVDHEWPLDIDHIYASALARRMHEPGNSRRPHQERRWVNTIGNMWLLDARANRTLQDWDPTRKFNWLKAPPEGHRVWPAARWSMFEPEVTRFIAVDARLERDLDGAMRAFAELVRARADRLLDTPFEELPEAKLFASDAELDPPEDWKPTDDALPDELADRLGLSAVIDTLTKAAAPRPGTRTETEPTPRQLEAVLAHAQALGQRTILEDLVAAADRLGLHPRPYTFSVMFTPRANKTRMLFTATPEPGGLHVWIAADTFEKFLPGVSADEARRQLGPAERVLDATTTQEFIAGLERLLHSTSSPSPSPGEVTAR